MTLYVIDNYTLDTLKRVMQRLYNERRIDGDERRDLANALWNAVRQIDAGKIDNEEKP